MTRFPVNYVKIVRFFCLGDRFPGNDIECGGAPASSPGSVFLQSFPSSQSRKEQQELCKPRNMLPHFSQCDFRDEEPSRADPGGILCDGCIVETSMMGLLHGHSVLRSWLFNPPISVLLAGAVARGMYENSIAAGDSLADRRFARSVRGAGRPACRSLVDAPTGQSRFGTIAKRAAS
jgi:hypothetical protein